MSLEGHRIGDFEILQRLGQGGMGSVYKARQVSLGRFVALKTLQSELADDPEYIARFQQEARAAAGLMHPNLVQVFSAGETDGLHWFAMEFVEGESAKARLKRKNRIDAAEAIAIAIHVATALEYGWRKTHLIHRDIKPDNIFLSQDGEVKLGDLGLAKSAGQTQGLTVTGHSMGTPYYISPEQVESTKSVDLRADIYSLGCTLYHMLSGQPPFDGNSAVAIMMKHVSGPVPNLKSVWPECPKMLAEVVFKMMRKNPAHRYQSYQEVIGALREAYEAMSNQALPTVVAAAPNAGPQPKPVAATKPQTPPKIIPAKAENPRTLLYVGLIGGSLIIGSIYFFVFKTKEAKITRAERWAQEHASDQTITEGAAAKQEHVVDALNGKFIPVPTASITNIPTASVNSAGEIHVTGGAKLAQLPAKDLLLRGELLVREIDATPYIHLRSTDTVLRMLQVRKGETWLQLGHIGADYPILDKISYPQGFDLVGTWIPFQFAVVGKTSIARIGTLPIAAGNTEDAIDKGAITIGAKPGAGADFRKLEYLSLDGVPESEWPDLVREGLKISAGGKPDKATREMPFVNSLGMKFVPVQIVSGPTAGQRVLFSVWDTRVQDYAAYADARKVDTAWTNQNRDGVPVGRELSHPVVGVNWEDSQAFCQWLTEIDIADGKLQKGLKYRLPTDEEWSSAVGMPPEVGVTPADKLMKNSVDFPWGKDYPPTKNAGNYADETFHRKFPKTSDDKKKEQSWIVGYEDGYETTSPVGSFSANSYGIYDMGGNVWQWCEDWFDASQKTRVLRGASWASDGRYGVLSSIRFHQPPGTRNNGSGFRCVLAAAPN